MFLRKNNYFLSYSAYLAQLICNFNDFQTMFLTFGLPAVSVTSRVARIDAISSQSPFTVGSGQQIVKKWHQPIKLRLVGVTIPGLRQATRSYVSLTMQNSILIKQMSLVSRFSTMFITMVLLGTMLLVTMRSHLSARTRRNSSVILPTLIAEFDFNLNNKKKLSFFNFHFFFHIAQQPMPLLYSLRYYRVKIRKDEFNTP